MSCAIYIYTINISIIHIIIQYFIVLNKFSVINLLQKNDGGPQNRKNVLCDPRKKQGAHLPIPELIYQAKLLAIII